MSNDLSRNRNIDAEIASRISKTSITFDRLRKSVWEGHGIDINTKVDVCCAVVFTSLI